MPLWVWIFIVLAAALFGLKLTYVVSTGLVLPITQGAVYVSSSRVRIAAFLDAVPMPAGQLLIDLGCGDGRVLRQARARYDVRAVGYEINPLAYLQARLRCWGLKDVGIRRQNFWRTRLSEADVVFCYLYPDVMGRLSDKLNAELKPGAVVVSCNFALPGWTPAKVVRPGSSLHNDPIFIYKAGAQAPPPPKLTEGLFGR
ncbi:MAG: class I SAM-dependent methyltransferase [Desulfobacterales bacterium]|nr:MAG: class I SAM-dependent methyltransferase [Desulfobacterales bacterium]